VALSLPPIPTDLYNDYQDEEAQRRQEEEDRRKQQEAVQAAQEQARKDADEATNQELSQPAPNFQISGVQEPASEEPSSPPVQSSPFQISGVQESPAPATPATNPFQISGVQTPSAPQTPEGSVAPAPSGRPAGPLVPDQLGDPQLSYAEAQAACGPAAAVAFARAYGREPTLREATDLAKQVGWTPDAGMAGPGSQLKLLTSMGVPARLEQGADWAKIQQDVQSGNPVTISTPAHYFVATDYDPVSGKFNFEKSGSVMSRQGGSEWMTPEQVMKISPPQATLYLDHPSTPNPSPAVQGTTVKPGPIDRSNPQAFLASAAPYAQQVQAETGIPANIMLGIAANETGYGKSAPGNNFFGIKGANPQTGATFNSPTWESVNGQRVNTTANFRAYDDPAQSFRDFAVFLQSNPRYAEALKQTNDPEAFIRAVHAAGYATDPNWSSQVLSIARQVGSVSPGAAPAGNRVGGGFQSASSSPSTPAQQSLPTPAPYTPSPYEQDFLRRAAPVVGQFEAATGTSLPRAQEYTPFVSSTAGLSEAPIPTIAPSPDVPMTGNGILGRPKPPPAPVVVPETPPTPEMPPTGATAYGLQNDPTLGQSSYDQPLSTMQGNQMQPTGDADRGVGLTPVQEPNPLQRIAQGAGNVLGAVGSAVGNAFAPTPPDAYTFRQPELGVMGGPDTIGGAVSGVIGAGRQALEQQFPAITDINEQGRNAIPYVAPVVGLARAEANLIPDQVGPLDLSGVKGAVQGVVNAGPVDILEQAVNPINYLGAGEARANPAGLDAARIAADDAARRGARAASQAAYEESIRLNPEDFMTAQRRADDAARVAYAAELERYNQSVRAANPLNSVSPEYSVNETPTSSETGFTTPPYRPDFTEERPTGLPEGAPQYLPPPRGAIAAPEEQLALPAARPADLNEPITAGPRTTAPDLYEQPGRQTYPALPEGNYTLTALERRAQELETDAQLARDMGDSNMEVRLLRRAQAARQRAQDLSGRPAEAPAAPTSIADQMMAEIEKLRAENARLSGEANVPTLAPTEPMGMQIPEGSVPTDAEAKATAVARQQADAPKIEAALQRAGEKAKEDAAAVEAQRQAAMDLRESWRRNPLPETAPGRAVEAPATPLEPSAPSSVAAPEAAPSPELQAQFEAARRENAQLQPAVEQPAFPGHLTPSEGVAEKIAAMTTVDDGTFMQYRVVRNKQANLWEIQDRRLDPERGTTKWASSGEPRAESQVTALRQVGDKLRNAEASFYDPVAEEAAKKPALPVEDLRKMAQEQASSYLGDNPSSVDSPFKSSRQGPNPVPENPEALGPSTPEEAARMAELTPEDRAARDAQQQAAIQKSAEDAAARRRAAQQAPPPPPVAKPLEAQPGAVGADVRARQFEQMANDPAFPADARARYRRRAAEERAKVAPEGDFYSGERKAYSGIPFDEAINTGKPPGPGRAAGVDLGYGPDATTQTPRSLRERARILNTAVQEALVNDQAPLEQIERRMEKLWADSHSGAKLPDGMRASLLNRMDSYYRGLDQIQNGLTDAYRHVGPDAVEDLKKYMTSLDNIDKAEAVGRDAYRAEYAREYKPPPGLWEDLKRAEASKAALNKVTPPASDVKAQAAHATRLADAEKRVNDLRKQYDTGATKFYDGQEARAKAAGEQARVERKFSGGHTADTSAQEIQRLQALYAKDPENWAKIEQAQRMIQDNVIAPLRDRMVQSGMISQDLADRLGSEFKNYIPIDILDYMKEPQHIPSNHRIGLNDIGLRKLTEEGTTRRREDPTSAVVRLVLDTERRASKNETANAVWKWRELDPSLASMMREVPSSYHATNNEKLVHLFVDGEKKTLAVDAALAPAFEFPTAANHIWHVGPLNFKNPIVSAANLTRATATTYNPAFALIRNPLLDAPAYWHDSWSRYGLRATPEIAAEGVKGFIDAFKGLRQNAFTGEHARELFRGGAGQFGYFGGTQKEVEQLRRAVEQGGGYVLQNKRDAANFLLHATPVLGERVEMAPRIAAMQLAKRHGLSELAQTTAGRDVTMDFSRGGQLTKAINTIVPFFNVNTQTLPWLARTLQRNPKGAAISLAALVGTPTLAAEIWNRSDPERAKAYDDIPPYIKQQGIVFMLDPNQGIDEQGRKKYNYVIAPMRNFGMLVNPIRNMAARAFAGISGQNYNAETWQELAAATLGSGSPVPIDSPSQSLSAFLPAITGTFVQLLANHDFFKNTTIATTSADEHSSALSKWFAKSTEDQLNWTPAQVEFAIRDASNSLGGQLLAASDIVAKVKENVATGQPMGANLAPLNPTWAEAGPLRKAITANLLQSRGGYQERKLSQLRDGLAQTWARDFRNDYHQGIGAAMGLPPDVRTTQDQKLADLAGELATVAVYGSGTDPRAEVARIQQQPGFVLLPPEKQADILAHIRQSYAQVGSINREDRMQRMEQAARSYETGFRGGR
jgi:flagellum-specific peptidoglycan hydrolase FlgJ